MALAFDGSGNVYVGLNSTNTNVKKFDPTGKLLDQFTVRCDYTVGVQGMDLAADQHTLFYGASSPRIHRYDLATHQQLPDFATNSFGSDYFRILPDGGLVTADQHALRRYNTAGQ